MRPAANAGKNGYFAYKTLVASWVGESEFALTNMHCQVQAAMHVTYVCFN